MRHPRRGGACVRRTGPSQRSAAFSCRRRFFIADRTASYRYFRM
ncbi:hypothetical protein A33M_0994 [Rhodovulum sp. PH10]|nr:hypothetical protein A33M_0994 [Rhodovulum sp. PH10]